MNNVDPSEYERQLQARAEQAERDGLPASGDTPVDRYRLVLRALRQPVPLALSEDFSAGVMQRIQAHERRSAREDAVVTGVLVLMGIAGLWLAYPYLLDGIGQLRINLPYVDLLAGPLQRWAAQLPWGLLLVTAFAIGSALALERLLGRAMPRIA